MSKGKVITVKPGQEEAFLRSIARQVRALNAKLTGPPRKKKPARGKRA